MQHPKMTPGHREVRLSLWEPWRKGHNTLNPWITRDVARRTAAHRMADQYDWEVWIRGG